MAYNPVKTVATGSIWSSKDWNRYIRDNFAAGIPDIFTTKGDLAVATGADATARVAAGPNGSWLFADSGATTGVIQALPNRISVMPAGAVGAASYNQWAKFTYWDTEVYDPAATFASDRFTCQHAGMYLVVFGGGGDGGTGNGNPYNYIKLGLYKNGVLNQVIAADYSNQSGITVAGYKWFANGITMVNLVAGDYLEVYYYFSEATYVIGWDSAAGVINYWMVHFLA